MNVLLQNARCVLPGGVTKADVRVRAGKIAAIGRLTPDAGDETIDDLHGLVLLPGCIDTQVHFREPGLVHKEDLESGSRAAVAGGISCVFEMPNTAPPTTTPEALTDKLQRAAGRMYCDHAFYMGATGDNDDALRAADTLPGCAGVKVFMGSSTGSLLVDDDARLDRVMAAGTRRVAVHAEDEALLRAQQDLGPNHVRAHPMRRSVEAALRATQRAIAAAERFGRKLHILHVSTAEEAALLAHHKDRVTMEVTLNHLTLQAPDCYNRFGTLAQMNPPVREARHRAALWQAVRDGTVDILATDHAPHTADEKADTYPRTPSGIASVEHLLPIMLTHVNAGRLSLLRLVDLLCHGPQRVFGLASKGRLCVGYDADFTVIDLKRPSVIDATTGQSKCKVSPYHGMRTTGLPVRTYVRGRCVMRDGEIIGVADGQAARFV